MTSPTAMQRASGLARHDPRRLWRSFLDSYSPRTREAYRRDLEDFAKWTGAANPAEAMVAFIGLGQGEANQVFFDYMNWLKAAGRAPGTVNRRRAAMGSFLRLARMLGLTAITLEVRRVRDESYADTRGPSIDSIREMLFDLEDKGRCGDKQAVRDLAIVRLLFARALRVGEVVALDVDHYDREHARLSIQGKGRGRREWVTTPPHVKAALDAWLAVRGDAPGPLFICVRRASGRITSRQVYRLLVTRYGVKPHGLRHAAITAALELSGGDTTKVQRFSRHKSLAVLQIYDDRRQDFGGAISGMVDELA